MAPRSAEARGAGPEAALLLRCARIGLEPGGREEILRLAGSGLDWEAFFALAADHGMVPLAFRHLNDAAQVIPKPVMVELWARYEAIARRNRALAKELLAILAALDAAGIPAIPYKGPALAFSIYGNVAMREYGDLDILVRAQDVLRGKDLLQARGYAPQFPLAPGVEAAFLSAPSQHHVVLAGAGATVVELHWKTDPDFPVERDEDAWWAGLGRARLDEATVRCFADRDLLLVLCLHGSRHWWGSLGWLVDVAEMVRRDARIEWDWIFARARELACARRLALGLHLAERLLGAPLPEAVGRRVAAHPGVAELAHRIEETLFARDAGLNALQGLRMNLSLYERLPQRLAHLANTLVEPSLVEWTRWPLPRALFFLYPALRIMRLARKYSSPRSPAAATPRTPPPPRHSTG